MSKVRPVPEGFHTITANFSVDGAHDAIAFYKKAFGAEEIAIAPDPSGKKVWHGDIKIGDSHLFVADANPDMNPARKNSVWMYVDNVDAWFKRATEAGAQVKMPPMDMFWGDRFASVVDKWGNEFNLATHIKDLTREEMKKAEQEFVAQMAKQQKH